MDNSPEPDYTLPMNNLTERPGETGDIIIIGAGAVGCAVARRLSRYKLDILLLEAGDDVASGASKANSGIVHGGYTAKAGSLKGELCIRGNRLFQGLEDELQFGYKRTGSLVLAFEEADLLTLEKLVENGGRNGVKGLEILSSKKVLSRYPALNPRIQGALFCPETGIVSPYEYTIALAENAVANGVRLRLDREVLSIEREGSSYVVNTINADYKAPLVINAAGVHSARVARMAGACDFQIRPRKGQYLLLRRGSAESLDTVVFQPPTEKGKGILVTPTVWGNLLVGPDAQEVNDPADLANDAASLAAVFNTARKSLPSLDPSRVIRLFSGVRPAGDRGDFIIEESPVAGFFNLGGIESPGLTSSPAIALKVEDLLQEKGVPLNLKDDYEPCRQAIVRPGPLGPMKEAAELAKLEYGHPERMVCRCEQVTERAVKEAIGRNIPIRSLDAVKRRTRAGMGICQGSFCGDRVREYLVRERGLGDSDVSGPSRDREEMRRTLEGMRSLLG